ncbi:hypothetical protein BH24ACT15_BH24ACT15_31610 [soil metagenome]
MSRAIRLWSAVPLALGMLVGAVSGMAPAREATPVWEPGAAVDALHCPADSPTSLHTMTFAPLRPGESRSITPAAAVRAFAATAGIDVDPDSYQLSGIDPAAAAFERVQVIDGISRRTGIMLVDFRGAGWDVRYWAVCATSGETHGK